MAVKGMSEFRADGENYTINDPNIANEFDATAAYAAGDYVYYQGNLYRFTAAHASGAWAGTDATQVKLGGDVSELNIDIGKAFDYVDSKCDTYINKYNVEAMNAAGLRVLGDEVVGTAVAFASAYTASPYFPVDCEAGKQYVFSFDAYTEQNAGSPDNVGLRAKVIYSDDTGTDWLNLANSTGEVQHRSLTTTSGKTVKAIRWDWGNEGYNIWHVKNIMLARSDQETSYVPYYIPKDSKAREANANVTLLGNTVKRNAEGGFERLTDSWIFGQLQNNGNVAYTKTYCTTENILSFDRTINIVNLTDDFYGYLGLYNNNDEIQSYDTVVARQISIPAGQKFRITLRKSGGEVIDDVNYFVNRFMVVTEAEEQKKIQERAIYQIEKLGRQHFFQTPFYVGNAQTGVIYPNYFSRVYSDIMQYDRRIILRPANGFRVKIASYTNEDVYESQVDIGPNTQHIIPEKKRFRICIYKEPNASIPIDFEAMIRGAEFVNDDLYSFPTKSFGPSESVQFEGKANTPYSSIIAVLPIKQSGSGVPSPSNVRSLETYSTASVNVSGSDTSNPDTYSVDLSGYYGGSIDFVKGVIKNSYIEFEEANQIYGFYNIINKNDKNGSPMTSARVQFRTGYRGIDYASNPNKIPNGASNKLELVTAEHGYRNAGYDLPNQWTIDGAYLSVSLPGTLETSEAIFNYLSANGIEIYYETTSPSIEYTTQKGINQKAGVNNVWSSISGSKAEVSIPISINDLFNESETVEKLVNGTIPDYWKTAMDNALSTINGHMANANEGDTFIYLADVHWYSNAQVSPDLSRYIVNNSNINFMMICGDFLTRIGITRQEAIDEAYTIMEAFKKVGTRVYSAFGNHDSNLALDSDQHIIQSKLMSLGQTYMTLFKQMEFYGINYFDLSTGFDYWFDKEPNKTRYIVLDTGEDYVAEGRSWNSVAKLSEVLNSTPDGWNIVVFAHIMSYGAFDEVIAPVLDAYNARGTYTSGGTTYDYSNGSGFVRIAMGGHMHIDDDWTTDGGIPCVITDCDATLTSMPTPPVKGTTTEQAFDVVTLDYDAGKAYFDRIGRGSSRVFDLYEES